MLTAKDLATDNIGMLIPAMPEDFGAPKGYRASRPLLSGDKARSVGDRMAFVVAETEDQARAAAELVEVDYEPLPAVSTIAEAIAPNAPTVWDDNPGNVAFIMAMGNKDAADAAFAKAKHVVTLTVTNNRVSANSIEPRAAIGDYAPDSDSYTLYTTSQNPARLPAGARRAGVAHSGDAAARGLAGRRRRLRHEGQPLSGGRPGAVGLAQDLPSGEMDLDPRRSLAGRRAWPRPGRHRRNRARRQRQDSRHPRQLACTRSARTSPRRHSPPACSR